MVDPYLTAQYIKRLLTEREVCTENIRPRSRQYGPSVARSVQKRPRSDIFRTDRASEVNNSFIIWLFHFRVLPTLFPVCRLMRICCMLYCVYGMLFFQNQTPAPSKNCWQNIAYFSTFFVIISSQKTFNFARGTKKWDYTFGNMKYKEQNAVKKISLLVCLKLVSWLTFKGWNILFWTIGSIAVPKAASCWLI